MLLITDPRTRMRFLPSLLMLSSLLQKVEMSDARAIVRDASGDSLVFVDELCKGTEAKAGACIAAATLERLASHNGCLGLFATHLHDILELPIERSALELMRMETEPGDREGGKWRRRATWKIGHGVCTESLAFQVAEKYGVPDEIVQRAYALSLGLEQANARSTEVEAAKINGAAGGQEEVVEPSEKEEQEEVLSFDRGVQVLAGLASEALGEDADRPRSIADDPMRSRRRCARSILLSHGDRSLMRSCR